ncbi:hypothetical protein [Pseudoalteromonas rubra]|uniref:Uncharacterized protein n=1 Tax=Pseudoalteromonas rubra TaxID=43658 RepID=A0A0F4QK77_9GAMM|nr:hypothetical protein [Pseudoalteromonas rubra]KJZ07680.1 hypothetical protein TW77_14330 [Pseudoalteromonas rubra]
MKHLENIMYLALIDFMSFFFLALARWPITDFFNGIFHVLGAAVFWFAFNLLVFGTYIFKYGLAFWLFRLKVNRIITSTFLMLMMVFLFDSFSGQVMLFDFIDGAYSDQRYQLPFQIAGFISVYFVMRRIELQHTKS